MVGVWAGFSVWGVVGVCGGVRGGEWETGRGRPGARVQLPGEAGGPVCPGQRPHWNLRGLARTDQPCLRGDGCSRGSEVDRRKSQKIM